MFYFLNILHFTPTLSSLILIPIFTFLLIKRPYSWLYWYFRSFRLTKTCLWYCYTIVNFPWFEFGFLTDKKMTTVCLLSIFLIQTDSFQSWLNTELVDMMTSVGALAARSTLNWSASFFSLNKMTIISSNSGVHKCETY